MAKKRNRTGPKRNASITMPGQTRAEVEQVISAVAAKRIQIARDEGLRPDTSSAEWGKDRAGTYIGRLSICKAITEVQWQAGEEHAKLRAHWQAVTSMPGGPRGNGVSRPENQAVIDAANAAYNADMQAIAIARAEPAVSRAVHYDQPVRLCDMDTLRNGLTALAIVRRMVAH